MSKQIKFYTDAHVAKAIIRGLRVRGIDVISVQDTGMFSAPDEDHLQVAIDQGRVVFTQDRDFLRLHAAGLDHHGIVYAPQGTSIGEVIRGLMLIGEVLEPAEMRGRLEYL